MPQRTQVQVWFDIAALALVARRRLRCTADGRLLAATTGEWLPACDGLMVTVRRLQRAGLVAVQVGPVVVTDAGREALARTRAGRRVLAA